MNHPFYVVLVLLACGTTATAQQPTASHIEVWNITGRGPTQVQITNGTAVIIGDAPAATATPGVVQAQFVSASPAINGTGAVDALDEVNATRARRGLPPFMRDENLTRGAMGCAQARAARLSFGHTSNDFAFQPPGTPCSATGCAAYPSSYGWMSCATYDSYRSAGAAWAMGVDGKRYMSLFVR